MTGRRPAWVFYTVCALAVIATMAWLTVTILRLERRSAEADAEAAFQEHVRLALWRMESELTPFLTEEAARPYFHYAPFYSPERSYTRMLQPRREGDVVVPSPLLTATPRFCKLHFQIDGDGNLSSPSSPSGNLLDLAESEYIRPERVKLGAVMLDALADLVADSGAKQKAVAPFTTLINDRLEEAATYQQSLESVTIEPRIVNGKTEWTASQKMRREAVARQNAASAARSPKLPIPADDYGNCAVTTVSLGDLQPLWIEHQGNHELLLVREVRLADEQLLQGVWIDWPALKAALLQRVADILTDADVIPRLGSTDEAGLFLAGIPASLITTTPPPAVTPALSPSTTALAIGWLAVLAAIVAIGLVLRAVTELTERRGRFVSAVTHELRTPLTTFCLYSEMLADNLVPEDRKQTYFDTLKQEARRLARIVENVLCYARLSDIRSASHAEDIPLADALGRIQPRLAGLLAEAGMTLQADTDAAGNAVIHADEETLERILVNLVDNASKYANTPDNPVVHLEADASNGHATVTVRDHGPGIPARDRRRLTHAFERGSAEADRAKPGLGLGLSLVHDLARELGGELQLTDHPQGGTLATVTIPTAAQAPQKPDPTAR